MRDERSANMRIGWMRWFMVNSSLIPQRVPRICIGWRRIHTPAANNSTRSSAQGTRAFSEDARR